MRAVTFRVGFLNHWYNICCICFAETLTRYFFFLCNFCKGCGCTSNDWSLTALFGSPNPICYPGVKFRRIANFLQLPKLLELQVRADLIDLEDNDCRANYEMMLATIPEDDDDDYAWRHSHQDYDEAANATTRDERVDLVCSTYNECICGCTSK